MQICIMASGPSMCQSDAHQVRAWRDGGPGRMAIAVNNTARLAPWADVIYACDRRWWFQNIDWARSTGANLWAKDREAARRLGLNRAEMRDGGGNSGHQAVRLAMTEFDADRVILLGFDMQATGGRLHWHPDHPAGWPNPVNFAAWRVYLEQLASEFPDVEVVNCSRRTALDCFRRAPLEEVLSE